MKKTTKKRSYKNAVSIGIAAFASVALLSTGLAAFVLIRNAQADVTGNIVVAEVVDSSIKLTVKDLVDGEIRLDAAVGDNSGRVQLGAGDDEKGEKLSQVIDGTVELSKDKKIPANLTFTYTVNIFTVVGEEKTNANDAFNDKFIATNRLEYLGTGFALGEPQDITVTDVVEGSGNRGDKGDFTFTFGFAWGAKYGYMNPSKFFDSTTAVGTGTYGTGLDPVDYTDVSGASIPDNVVKQELEDLGFGDEVSKYVYVITITAANK